MELGEIVANVQDNETVFEMVIMVTVMAGKPVYQAWLPLRSGRQSWNQEAPTKKQHIELLSLPCLLRCLERQINFHKLQQIQQNMEKKNRTPVFTLIPPLPEKKNLFVSNKDKSKSCFFDVEVWSSSETTLVEIPFFFNSPKNFNSLNIFSTHQTFL